MNSTIITNKKELPEHVWLYVIGLISVGIIFALFSHELFWVRVSIALVLTWAGVEASCNTYTTFTFEARNITVGLPYRKFSLLWITANRTLTIKDEAWDEVQIVHVASRHSATKIMRRMFFFKKAGKDAYYFTAIGCADFEQELRTRFADKLILSTKTAPTYRDIRPFIENNPNRVI